MFVVVQFSVDGRPLGAIEAESVEKALNIIEDPLSVNQIDIYKVESPGTWQLLWWKPYGTGMPKINNKTRRRQPGKEKLQ